MTFPPLRALIAVSAAATLSAAPALAETQAQMIQHYEQLAGRKASAAQGKAFFLAKHTGGNPKTPSCSTCHTTDPHNKGQTRAGKVIQPMAVSLSPKRFTDPKKVEKWFRRNCHTVLGRACTAGEKADYIAYLSSL